MGEVDDDVRVFSALIEIAVNRESPAGVIDLIEASDDREIVSRRRTVSDHVAHVSGSAG